MTDKFESWARGFDDEWDERIVAEYLGEEPSPNPERRPRGANPIVSGVGSKERSAKGPERDRLIRELRRAIRQKRYNVTPEMVADAIAEGRPKMGVNGNAMRADEVAAYPKNGRH